MKKTVTLHLAVLLSLLLGTAPSPGKDIVERDTVSKTLAFTGDADGRRLVVDIVNGSMSVTGYDGSEVRVVAYRTVRAESRSRLEAARAEVSLEMSSDRDGVTIYEDSPDRRNEEDVDDGGTRRRRHRGSYRGWDERGYDVEFDVEVQVPSNSSLTLSTVNGDNIDVRDTDGDFEVSNVNGDIDMRSVSGSGRIGTVNGNVEVSFARNPSGRTSFRTLNGEIDVKFPSTPSADLRFKTMNGEVYTDFDVKGVPMPSSVREKRGGRKVYGNGGAFMVQSAGGGPELSFDTLNGDIYLSLKGEHR